MTHHIEDFAKLIPTDLAPLSGKVFYSGRNAFAFQAPIYILGVNPGGSPENYPTENVGAHTKMILEMANPDWSAFRDEVWEGRTPGTYGMAPRILYLFRRLGLSPGNVPASNLVFVRSRNEATMGAASMRRLADQCWPFHAAVIQELKPRVVLCMGKTAGRYVQNKLGANRLNGEFIEQNDRGWRSRSFANAVGINVVVATHPSVADWTAPNTDPSQLVIDAMR